ncbi:MAG: gfo/Idh/MocA family oxidoreductase, partial [Betaproteobacteria bacterium AqS2]|nr:gfo/Idh/MocA family oxidoreductase [Betaproteobacteria bacterium AqS2]
PIETDDTAALVMELAGGGLFSSSITLGAASNHSHLHVSFEHLSIDSGRDPQLREDWRLTPRSAAGEELIAALGEQQRQPEGFAGLFAEIAKDLRDEANEAVRLADARASIELLTAIYASHSRRAPAALPCAADDPLYQGWQDAHGVRPRKD